MTQPTSMTAQDLTMLVLNLKGFSRLSTQEKLNCIEYLKMIDEPHDTYELKFCHRVVRDAVFLIHKESHVEYDLTGW